MVVAGTVDVVVAAAGAPAGAPAGVVAGVDELEENGRDPLEAGPEAQSMPPSEPVPKGTDSCVQFAPKSVV